MNRSVARGRLRWKNAAAVCGSLCMLGVTTGCVTSYSEKIAVARAAAAAGNYGAGVEALDEVLGADGPEELPSRWKGDTPLAVLERASLLQASGEYALSARSLSAAEAEIEVLDISSDTVGEIGSYVYSGASGKYKTPPAEYLSINATNMSNYLALGDLPGARVEARRFGVIQDYLQDSEAKVIHAPWPAYLAGFVFEHLGEADQALRYYNDALLGRKLRSLQGPVRRLAKAAAFRGEGIQAVLAGAGAPPAEPAQAGDLLIVGSLGRVPYKVVERIPVGAAVGIAGTYVTGNLNVLKYSALKVVVYPELVSSGSRAKGMSVRVGNSRVPTDRVEDLGQLIRKEYDQIRPRIVGAALTRMITRAAAAEGARVAGKQAGNAGGIIGVLAALVVEGALVSVDDPDTRSWSFLPNIVEVARLRVSPGSHKVSVAIEGVSGASHEATVEVPPGGFAVVVVTDLR